VEGIVVETLKKCVAATHGHHFFSQGVVLLLSFCIVVLWEKTGDSTGNVNPAVAFAVGHR
jgi:hypothetical protein